MACEICKMSCSLCPYCDTESCPHYHDHDNEGRYWLYVLNREKSCYDVLLNAKNLKSIKEALNKITERKRWIKKYKYCYINHKVTYLPLIQLTITDGKYNWRTDINLLLDLEKKKLYYYDDVESNIKYGGIASIIKEWRGRLSFKK